MPIGTYTPPPLAKSLHNFFFQFFHLFFSLHFRCILLQISHKKCFFISISILGVPGLKGEIYKTVNSRMFMSYLSWDLGFFSSGFSFFNQLLSSGSIFLVDLWGLVLIDMLNTDVDPLGNVTAPIYITN